MRDHSGTPTELDAMSGIMTLFIGFHLLDRQILDRDGQDVGKVDDVELTLDDSVPRVSALLVGPLALGPRLGGRLGQVVTGIASRLHPHNEPGPLRIPYDLVAHVDADRLDGLT